MTVEVSLRRRREILHFEIGNFNITPLDLVLMNLLFFTEIYFTFSALLNSHEVFVPTYRVRHKDLPIRKVKASHDLIFVARGTKFWHARDAHVPLEYAKYKTFQWSSYATMARTSRREGSCNKGRDFTNVRVIEQQNNHIKRSETLQSDRCQCQQDYSVQEEVGTCEEGGRSCAEEDL